LCFLVSYTDSVLILGDAGYSNSEYVLTPYRGVRYHLKEQRLANQTPQNKEELFNLRHSSLRNVVERIFGVFKGQWKILAGRGCDYSIETQVDLVLGLVALHNFIRDQGEDNEVIFQDGNIIETQEQEIHQSRNSKKTAGSIMMDQKREKIAEEMWRDYQLLLASKK
jgi:DDE superfamily endonuclease